MFSEFSCSLCSLLQADEGRREEVHSTPGKEQAVVLYVQANEGRREEAHSTPGEEQAVVLYVLCCRRMKADVKKHIRLPEKSKQLFFMYIVAGE